MPRWRGDRVRLAQIQHVWDAKLAAAAIINPTPSYNVGLCRPATTSRSARWSAYHRLGNLPHPLDRSSVNGRFLNDEEEEGAEMPKPTMRFCKTLDEMLPTPAPSVSPPKSSSFEILSGCVWDLMPPTLSRNIQRGQYTKSKSGRTPTPHRHHCCQSPNTPFGRPCRAP